MKFSSFANLLILVFSSTLLAQTPKKPSASELYHELQKLNFLGSAMYIAAHPDDENTRLISYLANDVKARTAYLSLTRGDGGQNLIGPELREQLGVIRTNELLEARKIDGGNQFFTRANDFGYSKHPDETLEIWNKEEVLGDVVRAIRKFEPDVIVNRFDHRSPGSTHGHHTSSAMLSVEAYEKVNNPNIYPTTAKEYGTWQPRRLFFNTSWWFYGSREKFEEADKTNLLGVETGNYYTNLGLSNGEIAGLSRSMHKSQGFGSTGDRGSQTEYLELLAGDMPKDKSNLFDGIDTTWSRIEGGENVGAILYEIERNFNFKDPASHIPKLVEAYELLNKLPESHWKKIKLHDLKEFIAHCAGLFLEVTSDREFTTPKGEVVVSVEAINRSNADIQLNALVSPVIGFPTNLKPIPLNSNVSFKTTSVENTFSGIDYTTPYWLQEEGTLGMYKVTNPEFIGLPERPDPFPVTFQMTIAGTFIPFERNIVYKENDPVRGEVYAPFDVLPIATTSIPEKVIIFSDESSKRIPVIINAIKATISGSISLNHPEGWKVSPAEQSFTIENRGGTQTVYFDVTPPKNQSEGYLKPLVHIGDYFGDKELLEIDYEHIPKQRLLMPSQAKAVRIPIEKKGESIGYIEGAGDVVPQNLGQIGYKVTIIQPNDIQLTTLQQYDAIVIGIRAFNTVNELQFSYKALNEYVNNGGTVIVQYNTSRGLIDAPIAPFSLELSRDRVTDENAKVTFLAKDHPVLNKPNKISESDFDGWVQERGLYFPDKWDNAFTPILEMHDKGESEKQGSLLVAKYGKGYYVYTGLSFFRELPAGVPGAYRLFANLLSLGN